MTYRDDVRGVHRERWFTARKLVSFFAVLALVTIAATAIFRGAGVVNEGITVATQEFGPREMLRKYEWFKDAAAQLEKKRADIALFEARLERMPDPPTTKWEAESRNQAEAELLGIQSSYNTLAAEYNAQMAKFNYVFANVGTLPKGAVIALPREFKPYVYGE